LVPIKENSIIYCDIPYKGTEKYDKNKHFNHDEFFDWAASQNQPVFISEYSINDKRFHFVKEIKTKSRMSSISPTDSIERIYCNNAALKYVRQS
jgi:DNA adenine methylase